MTDVMPVMSSAYLMVNGRSVVQQASRRIALESARFYSESEAIKVAHSVGLDASQVATVEGGQLTTLDDTYRIEIDVAMEILRIKAAQQQVKLGVKLHSLEDSLNDDVKGLLR